MSTLQVIAIWALFVVALPSALGALVALPFWLKGRIIVGNIAGSFAIILVIVILIWRQIGAYFAGQAACPGPECVSPESTVVTLLVMAGLSWLDTLFLLMLSGVVEDRRRQKHFDRSRL